MIRRYNVSTKIKPNFTVNFNRLDEFPAALDIIVITNVYYIHITRKQVNKQNVRMVGYSLEAWVKYTERQKKHITSSVYKATLTKIHGISLLRNIHN